MCVPKSEEELGCSFLLSPGKKAGQQECGTVGREALLPSIASTSLVQKRTEALGNSHLLQAHILNFSTLRPRSALLTEKRTKLGRRKRKAAIEIVKII